MSTAGSCFAGDIAELRRPGQLAFEVDTAVARPFAGHHAPPTRPLGEVLVVDHARKRNSRRTVVGLLVPRRVRLGTAPKPSPIEARQRRGRYSSSARSSRQRWASLRSLVRKPSIRASLALIWCARDSLSTSASSRVTFCSSCAFLVVAPLVAR